MPDQIRFSPNIVQQLALADLSPMLEEHQGWDMWLYELTDGRTLAVSPEVAAKINGLDLRPGEPFHIVKRWNGERRQKARWDVWLSGETEKARAQAESSDLENQLRQSIEIQASKRTMPTPLPQKPTPKPTPPLPDEPTLPPAASQPAKVRTLKTVPQQLSLPWEDSLKRHAKALTDVYAETLAYSSERHGNSVKADDIRSLVITAFISESQRGGRGGFNAA